MLGDVVDLLRCPVCGSGLALAGQARIVACAARHSFDVARQGYVSLLTQASPGTADTPEMVAARSAFLATGAYQPLASHLARSCTAAAAILDAGAGTGHYLAHALPGDARGIALDVSKHALKVAAKAHPRIGAVVADVWRPLPVRDESVDVVLNVFAPRNAAEFARVLRPGGRLIVVTPGPGHLRELIEPLGMLTVDEDKERRVNESLGGAFARAVRDEVTLELDLDHEQAAAVAGMGPSAWHTDPRSLIGTMPERLRVTASFQVSEWLPRKP
ncbi:methyltransferase domain-containing protein [Streptosporangiaceae bacterium NEAU-GS5]|nr:methyltransferase domain-containing protein [Streptosporangiaceae bacterium NEAU-GS5]